MNSRIKTKVKPKSGFGKLEIAKLGALEILLPCVMTLLKIKSSVNLLDKIKICKKFF